MDFIDVAGKILKADCKYYMTEKNGGRYSCNLQVMYEINGKKYYGNVINDSTIEYKNGSNITIQYHKNDLNIIKVKPEKFDLTFIFLLLIAILIINMVQGFYKYYMAHKYNTYSSIYGASTAFGHGFRSQL